MLHHYSKNINIWFESFIIIIIFKTFNSLNQMSLITPFG